MVGEYLSDFIGALRSEGGWLIQALVVMLVTAAVNVVQRRVLQRLEQRLATTANLWDDALIGALRLPLTVLVWVIGLAFAASLIEKGSGLEIFSAVAPLRDVAVIGIIVWFLVRFIRQAQHNLLLQQEEKGQPLDRTTVDAIGKLLRISVIIVGVLVVLQTMGYSIHGVLAFGGIGGIAVGFAAKDLLANFFGGLMIYLDRPFAVGDTIRSPDREIEGAVEHIGWRQTLIRTPEKRPLYVPNSVFTNIAVENVSRMSHRRINEVIGIRYEDAGKLGIITTAIRDMLTRHPEVDASQEILVNFDKFGPSSLDFLINAYTTIVNRNDYYRFKHDILMRIHDIIAAQGAEIAYPTSSIHITGIDAALKAKEHEEHEA